MSKENKLKLSRRKMLASAGAIGAASAGAGLGTSAYFSDQESFDENTLTAGELDLKLDYRATYAGGPGRLDEIDAMYDDFDVEEVDDEEGTYLVGEIPEIEEGDLWEDEVQDTDFCDPDVGLINGDEMPVFTLDDVKPGDAGEVTVSLHICDNPAWLYMGGELTENAENGQTDPETEVDESGGDLGDGAGELADAIETTVWYDENCNNVLDGEGEGDGDAVCVQMVIDDSGSMSGPRIQNTRSGAKSLAETVLNANPDNKVGVTRFDTSASTPQSLTDNLSAIESAIDNDVQAGGGTNAQAGVDEGQAELEENCPEGHKKVMVVFGDGDINTDGQSAKDAGIEIFAIGVGGASLSDLEGLASEPTDEHVFLGANDEAIEQLFAQVGETITEGEEVITSGTLAEVMADLEDGVALDGDRSSEDRDPFMPSMTHCLGFEWEVPADVGNKIQTDSVGFDLAFGAEQYRHNENPQNPFAD